MPKLDLLTKDEVREVIREELAAFAEALLAKLIQKPVLKGRRAAAAYVGMSREELKRAEDLGFIRPLPWKHKNAPIYDAQELVKGARLYAQMFGRNGGEAPEEKAAAGAATPAKKGR